MKSTTPPSDCSACGACCRGRSGTVLLVDTDVERWLSAGRSDLMKSRVAGHFGQKGLAVDAAGDCVHLDRDRRCSIYELRPDTCRDFEIGCAQCLEARALMGLDGGEGCVPRADG